ncbi:lipopolysaccharide biosynthesis protein [Bacillus manliponensis]|uniref:lipopolysaccharide biosynthesis protein n=1 Tax=Bacillus manliponensis TaxID=574376 RepID=UPI0035136AF4
MRTKNSLKNMFHGTLGQFISIGMGFLVRTAFIYTLGIEYLGIDGLFTSILMMLSLANLGFDTAMIYSLYKPLAENDYYKVQALMNLYRKAYQLIGLIVLVIGLLILPFLSYFMNGEEKIDNITVIYLLFLLNSVTSYYFTYKQSIIIADQRNHIISKIHTSFMVISNITQIILLLITKNYIMVLLSQVIIRIIENIYIANRVNKLYPYMRERSNAVLSLDERKSFFKNLYALFLYRISGVVINGTDNVVISKFSSLTLVGVYANYLLIINTVNTFISYLFYSITASIGNLHVTESKEKKYSIFCVLHFVNFWIYGLCSIFLWNLINPFLTVWLGESYVFDKYIVFVLVLNFYTSGMQNAATTFRETTGLFIKGKYNPIIASIINIVVSIVLAKQIGVAGVLLGTIISRLCTYFWYDPYIIFKSIFNKPVKIYFLKYALYMVLVFISAILTDLLGSALKADIWINMLIRIGLCLIIPNMIFWIVFRRAEETDYVFNTLKNALNESVLKLLVKKYFSNRG